jgi:hypothetical protein
VVLAQLIVAEFRVGKRRPTAHIRGDANKTLHPAIGGASGGCNFVGIPERASRARRISNGVRLLGRDERRNDLPMTHKGADLAIKGAAAKRLTHPWA